jgi:hypothetical protein
MALNKMFIPTFIANAEFQPAQVRPRMFFYNSKLQTSPYSFGFKTGVSTSFYDTKEEFPYFDHYSTGSGEDLPATDSDSNLFLNEAASLGSIPNDTLYTKYWSKYITLLYDPKTRLIECAGIIPFADYVELQLNDIVFFRGNHYHLRAINQYNLKTGECQLQLLGPIIDDALDENSTPYTPPSPPPPAVYSYKAQRTGPSGTISATYIDPYGTQRSFSYASAVQRWFAGQSIVSSTNATLTSSSLTIPNDDVVSGSLDTNTKVNTQVTASRNGISFFADGYYLSGSSYDRYHFEVNDLGGSSSQLSDTCMISGSLIMPDVQNGFSTLTINENGAC